MTGIRWFAAFAFGLVLAFEPATAATFDAQAAKKTCVDQYNREKEGGTIPAGMAKSKYVNQCFSSMRKNAQLEQQLAEEQSGQAGSSGSNELTPTTPATPPKPATKGPSSKPARVTTPAFAPQGN